MNRTKMMIALASSLLVAQIAAAQMMGSGGGSQQGPFPPSGNNPFGGMNGGVNAGMNGGMGQSLTVGPDGVVYTLRTSAPTGTQSPAVEVVAIRPSGTVAWTTKVEGRMTRLELSGTLVLVASGSGDIGMGGWKTIEAGDDSRLVALSAAAGSVQWQLDLDGHVGAFAPFSGGVYTLIIRSDGANGGNGMHSGSNGTRIMKRSVTAIDNTGKALWSIDLN